MTKRSGLLLAPVAALLLAGSGCVTGKVLYLPGELSRPGAAALVQPSEGPAVAVLDFTYSGSPPYEIGRDFDHARSIVWRSNPGRALADLVADALAEKGIRAVRVPGSADVPPGAAARVWGRVDELKVSSKKTGSLRLSVEVEASVSATLFATGGSAPPGWSSNLGSDYWNTEPLFVTPEAIRTAVNGAANAVAEEAVSRLFAAGVIARPEALPPDTRGGTPR